MGYIFTRRAITRRTMVMMGDDDRSTTKRTGVCLFERARLVAVGTKVDITFLTVAPHIQKCLLIKAASLGNN